MLELVPQDVSRWLRAPSGAETPQPLQAARASAQPLSQQVEGLTGSARRCSWDRGGWGHDCLRKYRHTSARACMCVHACSHTWSCVPPRVWSLWLEPGETVSACRYFLLKRLFFFLTGFKHAQLISATGGKHRALSDYICSPGHLQSKHCSPDEKYNYYPLLDIPSHCLTTKLHS